MTTSIPGVGLNPTWRASDSAKANTTFHALRFAVAVLDKSPALAASPEVTAIAKKYFTLPAADPRVIEEKIKLVYPWSKAIADGKTDAANLSTEQVKILQGAYLLVDAGIRAMESDEALQHALQISRTLEPSINGYKAYAWDMGELMRRKDIPLPSREQGAGR